MSIITNRYIKASQSPCPHAKRQFEMLLNKQVLFKGNVCKRASMRLLSPRKGTELLYGIEVSLYQRSQMIELILVI